MTSPGALPPGFTRLRPGRYRRIDDATGPGRAVTTILVDENRVVVNGTREGRHRALQDELLDPFRGGRQ